jgi:hypothetical protein
MSFGHRRLSEVRAEEVWHLAYGCVFLALNTAVALAPGWLLGNRFRGRAAAVGGGVLLGGVASFTLGGVWFVLLPRLWEPPPSPDYNPWGWFVLTGFFSVGYAAAGSVAVAAILIAWSHWCRPNSLAIARGACGCATRSG